MAEQQLVLCFSFRNTSLSLVSVFIKFYTMRNMSGVDVRNHSSASNIGLTLKKNQSGWNFSI